METDETDFDISKHTPYDHGFDDLPSREMVLSAILDHMEKNNLELIVGETRIFIYPGYEFQLCDGLITNFHQPKSTLMLLVAAFIGEDWKTVYEEALTKGYRFLSYGDSSLLLPKES